MAYPTPYPDVNAIVDILQSNVQSIIGDHFIGMYLDGSLTSGDFDQDSDIDFVVVTDDEISSDIFLALQALHEHIAEMDSPWAIQLEGSYISLRTLRRYDPAHTMYPNIERGSGERLKMVQHDEAWAVHRYILRERGIVLAGPDPQTLIDPVSPDDLRQAMLAGLHSAAYSIPVKTVRLSPSLLPRSGHKRHWANDGYP
jgi:nucleotidyltransferase-like protein